MSDEVKAVELIQLPNQFIAEVVVGILKDEGVAAFVQGENLQDEFAASQRLIGNIGTTIFVPEDSLARAQEVLAAAREEGKLEAGDEAPEE